MCKLTRVGSTRRWLALVVALCALGPLAPDRSVAADETDAERAAREIADARDRANRAADEYFAAESLLDALEAEADQMVATIDDLEAQVAALTERVQQIAVNRFTRSSTAGSPLLNRFASAEEQMQISVLTAVITDTSEADFDEFDALNRELDRAHDELTAKRVETEVQRRSAEALRDQAMVEIENLKSVSAKRLQDEAVRKALAAEQRTRAAEAARSAQVATSDPGTSIAFDDIDSSAAVPDDPTLADEVGSGGQTGGGGTGGRPGGSGGVDFAGAGWVCPTGTAAVGFGDTWGAPRSGGRRHQGVDMIGERGTPVLAVVDGFVRAKEMELGGLTVQLFGVDGHRYFYGHFDAYGLLGDVRAGDVIGYMGDTGNAKSSTPHLHFEIHPNGGVAVNPYPTVRAHC